VNADDKGIKDTWKEYMEKLMNEENEWDDKISAGVKEGPADCIRSAEVTKSHQFSHTPSAFHLNIVGNPVQIFKRCLASENKNSWAIVWHDHTFSHFSSKFDL